MSQEAVEALAVSVANKSMVAGAASSAVGWLFTSEFGMLAGLMVAVIGLITSFYFGLRRDLREEQERLDRKAEREHRMRIYAERRIEQDETP